MLRWSKIITSRKFKKKTYDVNVENYRMNAICFD